MANLGTVAKTRKFKAAMTYHWWTGSPLSGNRIGKIYGHVKEQNTVVPNALVRLYWQDDGRLVAKTVSDAYGAYAFAGLSTTQTNKYLIAAFKRNPDHTFDFATNVVSYAHLTPSL